MTSTQETLTRSSQERERLKQSLLLEIRKKDKDGALINEFPKMKMLVSTRGREGVEPRWGIQLNDSEDRQIFSRIVFVDWFGAIFSAPLAIATDQGVSAKFPDYTNMQELGTEGYRFYYRTALEKVRTEARMQAGRRVDAKYVPPAPKWDNGRVPVRIERRYKQQKGSGRGRMVENRV